MKNQKHLFSLREDIHYLNCAYKAPLLKSAEEAAIQALINQRNPADLTAPDFFKEVEEARRLFAKLVNCVPSEVAIIPSTSYGFSAVLNNIPFKNGQHAITIENEFPSDHFSIKRWCTTHGAELITIKPDPHLDCIGGNWNNKILNSINDKTAVVIMSSIHWMNGLRFDLEKIGARCKAVGAKFIVDGTQSVGALPMDVKKLQIDALVCAGYKWMLGPYSLGLAYIGNGFHDGIPVEESWMNRTNAQDFSNLTRYDPEYGPGAARYSVGEISNMILMPMLIEGLKQIHSWTVPEIQAYCRELIQPLLDFLKSLGVQFENEQYFSNHLFSLKLPGGVDTSALKEILLKNKIYLSVRSSSLRVSVNVFNTSGDIEKLIEVVDKATRK